MEVSRFVKVSNVANLAWTWATEGAPTPIFGAVNGGWPAFIWNDAGGNLIGMVTFDAFGNPQVVGNPPVALPTGAPPLGPSTAPEITVAPPAGIVPVYTTS